MVTHATGVLRWVHMLYLNGVSGEDNYDKTRLDEKHHCFSPYGRPLVVLIHSR
jgi:hypothetical protein